MASEPIKRPDKAEPLRLQWKRTWPDKPRDFAATQDGRPIGRIYFTHTPDAHPNWIWSCYGRVGELTVNASGRALSKDEAARAVEAVWFDGLESIERGRPLWSPAPRHGSIAP